jgi:hypothetical protein
MIDEVVDIGVFKSTSIQRGWPKDYSRITRLNGAQTNCTMTTGFFRGALDGTPHPKKEG